jgi:hypothetical protein
MPSIAIVDDRKDNRETIERVVLSTLRALNENERWGVVADEPPARERDVLHWLDEHDATVLLTDWKLNEGAKGTRVVNYEADALIKEIRAKRPGFPIFVVTGFETEARTHLADVEGIFNRKEFTKSAKTVVQQMLRAGLRRFEEHRSMLARMDTLARRVASGHATAAQRTELKSIQGFFQADLPAVIDLDSVLQDLESAKADAEALRKKIERRMQPKGKR